jgi:hypothetical protein
MADNVEIINEKGIIAINHLKQSFIKTFPVVILDIELTCT